MHLLDIDQLRTFVAIADTGSFTRAAEIVHKTQSAVSMQMKRLEDRVGKAIFERDGRLSKLTDEGERLLDYARRIVRLNAECMASFNEHELTGRVRLGLPDDYADRYLPEILARFSRSNPKAEVTVMCEPQLGKRGLYPTLSTKESGNSVRSMMNLISYSDGNRSLLEIADRLGESFAMLHELAKPLVENRLLEFEYR